MNTDEGWAGTLGRKWLRALDQQETALAPIGEALLKEAAIGTGERVLEIGPGGGWLARRMAELVGPRGQVVGLDISADLIAEARTRSKHLPQVRFDVGDAATARPEGVPFDRLISRFGVMFFADPPVGFAHLASLLKPGAPMHCVVWADPKRNLWVSEVRQVMARHAELPTVEPRAPGQFQLADADFLDAAVAGGFVDIRRQLIEDEMLPGGAGASPEEAARAMMQSMAYGDIVADLSADAQVRLQDELTQLFSRYATSRGIVMPAYWWLVSARTPV